MALVGDSTYNGSDEGRSRMMLHAWRLELPFEPVCGWQVSVEVNSNTYELIGMNYGVAP